MPEQNKGRAKKSSEMERIKRELRKLAFGKANDCVKLALCEDVDIASLDLSLLTEIRKARRAPSRSSSWTAARCSNSWRAWRIRVTSGRSASSKRC